MPRPKTYSAGANVERGAILAHVRRLLNTNFDDDTRKELKNLIQWILKRDERYKKKKGGL